MCILLLHQNVSGLIQTFGAVVVLVELSVLRLPLPADQVVCQIAVGKDRRWPLHYQLGRGVGIRTRVLGHRRHCNRGHVILQKNAAEKWESTYGMFGILTWWACADVYYGAFGPFDVFVPHLQGDDFHKYSILGPGLEVQKSDFRVDLLVMGEIHVHHVPTVWSTAVLAVKLCDVLERTGEDRPKDDVFMTWQLNPISIKYNKSVEASLKSCMMM